MRVIGAELRICMITARFHPEMGGVERQARLLSESLARRGGVAVEVITRRYGDAQVRERIGGVTVRRVSPANCRTPSASFIARGTLQAVRGRYDVLHCHQLYSPSTIGALAASFGRTPVVAKVTASGAYGEVAAIRAGRFGFVRSLLLRRVDRFIAVNQELPVELGSIGVNAAKVEHIPNGVEIPHIPNLLDEKRRAKTLLAAKFSPLLVYTGRIAREKNIDVILQALRVVRKRCPEAGLIVVGEGGGFRNDESRVRQAASDLGQEGQVLFAGRVDHGDIGRYLLAADVFLLLSESEGLSNSLLEAMAHGCAIVASRIPGNERVVLDGREGILVPVRDADATAAAIEVLASSVELRMRLGEGARSRVLRECSIERVTDQYLDLYRRVRDEKLGGRSQ